MIFDKDAKMIHRMKENLFNTWCWSKWIAIERKVNLDPRPKQHIAYKNKLKWVTDLNGECKTKNILGKNIGENLHYLGSKILRFDTKTQSIGEKMRS